MADVSTYSSPLKAASSKISPSNFPEHDQKVILAFAKDLGAPIYFRAVNAMARTIVEPEASSPDVAPKPVNIKRNAVKEGILAGLIPVNLGDSDQDPNSGISNARFQRRGQLESIAKPVPAVISERRILLMIKYEKIMLEEKGENTKVYACGREGEIITSQRIYTLKKTAKPGYYQVFYDGKPVMVWATKAQELFTSDYDMFANPCPIWLSKLVPECLEVIDSSTTDGAKKLVTIANQILALKDPRAKHAFRSIEQVVLKDCENKGYLSAFELVSILELNARMGCNKIQHGPEVHNPFGTKIGKQDIAYKFTEAGNVWALFGDNVLSDLEDLDKKQYTVDLPIVSEAGTHSAPTLTKSDLGLK